MATYLMLGKYSLEALKAISAERSDKARALIKQNGGELKAGYALLGGAEYGRGVALAKILPTPDAVCTDLEGSTAPGISPDPGGKLDAACTRS